MKKHSIFGSALLSTALLLGACGDKEEVTDAVDSSQRKKNLDSKLLIYLLLIPQTIMIR